MACCTPFCQRCTIFTFASFFLIIGIILICLWHTIFQGILASQLNVGSADTTEFVRFKETPIPMYLQFYLFNWTNHDDVIKSNWAIPPNLQECGPYTFSEHHIRQNVTFNDNHTITFYTQRIWHFVPEKTNGSLQDIITTINPILASIGYLVKGKHEIIDLALNFLLKEKDVHLTRTKPVNEWLFDGYNDTLLDLVHKLNISGINVPYKKFGWFVERNKSIEYDGIFTMKDGTQDLRDLGRLTNWNGYKQTPYYKDHCGLIHGTTGEVIYPVQDDESIDVFSSDLCATITLEYERVQTIHGIDGRRYIGKKKVFDNGTKYPEMACFSPGEASPSGVRNVSQCKFGAPAFISYPHFYLADPFYYESFTGLTPNDSSREFAMVVEPSTGIPLTVDAAMQISLKLTKIPKLTLLSNVKEVYFPCLWFRQTAQLTEDLASQAKLLLILPKLGVSIGIFAVCLSGLLVLIGGYLIYRKMWKGTDGEQLLNQQSS